MGTPNFAGVIIVALAIPSFLAWSALILLSLMKIANKKGAEKKISLPWAGKIDAWKLLATCISCPIASAGIVIFGIGLAGVPTFDHFVALTFIVSVLLFPAYVAVFLLYAIYRFVTVKSMPGRKSSNQATRGGQDKKN
jgi:hypothetical protein